MSICKANSDESYTLTEHNGQNNEWHPSQVERHLSQSSLSQNSQRDWTIIPLDELQDEQLSPEEVLGVAAADVISFKTEKTVNECVLPM